MVTGEGDSLAFWNEVAGLSRALTLEVSARALVTAGLSFEEGSEHTCPASYLAESSRRTIVPLGPRGLCSASVRHIRTSSPPSPDLVSLLRKPHGTRVALAVPCPTRLGECS